MVQANQEIYRTQEVFRTLLDCMARPGKIAKIEKKLSFPIGTINEYVGSIVETLVDREVTFCFHKASKEEQSYIQLSTMSRIAEMDKCDYFIINGLDNADFKRLKKGSFHFPDQSATVICQVESLSTKLLSSEKSVVLTITGPGVKVENVCYIQGVHLASLEEWQNCNQEYPLGIDIILIDESGNVCCLPRSVKITLEEM